MNDASAPHSLSRMRFSQAGMTQFAELIRIRNMGHAR